MSAILFHLPSHSSTRSDIHTNKLNVPRSDNVATTNNKMDKSQQLHSFNSTYISCTLNDARQRAIECLASYIVGDVCGFGASSFVFECQSKETQVELVLKCIFKDRIPVDGWKRDIKTRKTIPAEIFYLMRAKHPNIVTYHAHYEDCTFFYLLVESLVQSVGEEDALVPTTNKRLSDPIEDYELNELTVSSNSSTLFDHQLAHDGYLLLRETIPASKLKHLFRQLVLAVQHLHLLSILHNDIKPENVKSQLWN